MVRKIGKFGTRNGSTQKFGRNVTKSKIYGKDQCVIIKQVYDPSNVGHSDNNDSTAEKKKQRTLALLNEHVPDGELHHQVTVTRVNWWGANTTTYDQIFSLNKRKRWLLPGIIKQAINEVNQNADNETEDQVRISLVERKISPIGRSGLGYYTANDIVLKNTCTGYHDSKLKEPHWKAKKTYSFEGDLKKAEKQKEKNADKEIDKRQSHMRPVRRSRHVQRPHLINVAPDADAQNQGNGRIEEWIFRAHMPAGNEEGDNDGTTPHVKYEICGPNRLIGHRLERDFHHFHHRDRGHSHRIKATKGHPDKSWNKTKSKYNARKLDWRNNIAAGLEHFTEEQFGEEQFRCDRVNIRATDSTYDIPVVITRKRKSQRQMNMEKKVLFDVPSTQSQSKKYGKAEFTCIPHPKKETTNNNQSEVFSDLPESMKNNLKDESFLSNTSSDSGFSSDNESLSQTDLSAIDKVPYVKVSLQKDSIYPTHLSSSFGGDYLEGYCFPRRFAVDLSDRLKSLGGHKTQAWLVVEPSPTEDEDGCQVVCGVQLEVANLSRENCVALCSQMEFIGSSNVQTLEAFVDSMLDDIQLGICENSSLTSQAASTRRYVKGKHIFKRYSLYQSLVGWTSEAYTAEEAYDKLQDEPLPVIQGLNRRCHSMTSVGDSFCVIEETYCDICFDAIIGGEGELLNGTALRQCHHWFCNDCWKNHVTERIKQGDVLIKCPGFKCESVVDHVTLLHLMSAQTYIKHLNHVQDVKLEVSQQWVWCPNSYCGRAIKLGALPKKLGDNVEEGQNVECVCGSRWCSLCLKDPHWPATCRQADTFTKLVQTKGDEVSGPTDMSYFVEVKHCPNCRHPINKSGGCQHMVCAKCHTEFCWECLGLWSLHSNLVCPKARVSETTVDIDQTLFLSSSEQFYFSAVAHRKFCRSWRDDQELKSVLLQTHKLGKTKTYTHDEEVELEPVLNSGWKISPEHKQGTVHRLGLTYGVEKEAEFLVSVKLLSYQIHSMLEQLYVVMSNSNKKQARTLGRKADNLSIIVSGIDDIVSGKVHMKMSSAIKQLQNMVEHALELLGSTVNSVRTVQYKLHKPIVKAFTSR